MENILLKEFIIFLLIIIIALLKPDNQNNKGNIMTEKKCIKSETKDNFYREMLELYFQNMQKEENLKWVELENHLLNQI